MKVERIDSSLHARSWSFNRQRDALARQVVMLTDGAGEAESAAGHFAIAAPAVAWLGSMKPGRLRTEAGTTGYRGWAADGMVIAAIGDQPESANLRYLADRDFVLSLAGQAANAAMAERCFTGVLAELGESREGSALVLSALLRVLLVSLLRASEGTALAMHVSGEKGSLLQRFRQLVEMNFRSHWSVTQYAAALGISPDRLHAICTSGIGKSPKALISERLAREAALRLERSTLTIEQLGYSLGFNDPAHFSHFFRKAFGIPPGTYRKAIAQAKSDSMQASRRNFADWP